MLAHELRVSRNIVVIAFEQLVAEITLHPEQVRERL
jgi:hypothetical protein